MTAMTTDGNPILFTFFWLATTFVAFGMAFAWLVSPLGLGFGQWPSEPSLSVVMAVFHASYFVGVPLLLVAQGVSIGLAKFRRWRWAFAVPAISITLFVAMAGFVLSQVRLD